MSDEFAAYFADLDDGQLANMKNAAIEVQTAMQASHKADSNIVMDILRQEDEILMDEHYPQSEVIDHESNSQYYYHCHRAGEHGHFHLFLNEDALPDSAEPVADQRLDLRDPDFTETFCHLIAIGMDEYGQPVHFFTTNRWVTQEVVFPAEQMVDMIDLFSVDHTYPAWSTNRWVTAMLVLFKPQIAELLYERDREYARLIAKKPDVVVYEDDKNEVLSIGQIDLEGYIGALDAACQARNI